MLPLLMAALYWQKLQNISKGVAVVATTKDGVSIKVVSKPLKAGNYASIVVNGEGSSVNHRGINIVVYDKTKQCVCDSVCFDTHVKTIDCHR